MNLEQKIIFPKNYKQVLVQAVITSFIGGIVGALTVYHFAYSRISHIQHPLTGAQALQEAWPKFSEERKDAIAAAVAAAIEATEPKEPPQSKEDAISYLRGR